MNKPSYIFHWWEHNFSLTCLSSDCEARHCWISGQYKKRLEVVSCIKQSLEQRNKKKPQVQSWTKTYIFKKKSSEKKSFISNDSSACIIDLLWSSSSLPSSVFYSPAFQSPAKAMYRQKLQRATSNATLLWSVSHHEGCHQEGTGCDRRWTLLYGSST